MKNIIYVLLFISVHVYSQKATDISEKYTPNSPLAYTFNNYSNFGNVDLATGKFGVNIPFTSISNEFINIPIGVQYQTSGVKVSDISSEIGMGWNFYGEGAITRELKGEPDEMYNTLVKVAGSINVEDPATGQTFTPFSNANDWYYGQLYSGRHYPSSYAQVLLKSNNGFTTRYLRGGLTSLFIDNVMYDFPNIKYFNGVGVPWELTKNEIEAVLLTSNKGVSDFKRDIFHVSAGDLKFSFAFRIKPEFINHSNSNYIGDNPIFQDMIEAVPIDDKSIKIEHFFSEIDYYKTWDNEVERTRNDKMNALTKFIITDKKGVRYTFDKYEFMENERIATLVNSKPNVIENKKFTQYSLEDIYIGTWKISKIEMPNGHKVEYLYDKNISRTEHEVPHQHTGEYKGNVKNLTPIGFNGGGLKHIYNGKEGWRLKRINHLSVKGWVKSIRFDYYLHRPDYFLGGNNLKKISLVRNIGITEAKIKDFEFIKFFAESDDGSTGKRMFLSEIRDSNKENPYLFKYNSPDDLPTTLAYWSADIFGYYRGGRYTGNINNCYFPEVYVKTNSTTEGNRISYFEPKQSFVKLSGTNRKPNPTFSKLGSLSKIIFPTKGALEIDYEPNKFYDSSLKSENQTGPGVRVKSLNYFSDNNQFSHGKRYEYTKFTDHTKSSGNLLYKPSYAYLVNVGVDNNVSNFFVKNHEQIVTYKELDRKGVSHNEILKKLTKISTHPLSKSKDVNGRELIYTNVKEIMVSSDLNDGLGYTEYTFHYNHGNKVIVNCASGPTTEGTYTQSATQHTGFAPSTFPWVWAGIPPGIGQGPNDGKMVMYGEVEKRGYDIFPFPEISYYGDVPYLNGNLIKKENFDSNRNRKSTEIFTYEKDFSTAEVDDLYNFNIGYYPTHVYDKRDPQKHFIPYTTEFSDGIYFFSKEKVFFNSPVNLVNINSISYNNNGNIINEITYNFNDDNLVSQETKNSNTNESIVSKYFYPKENDTNQSQGISNEMILKNRISEVLKTEYLIKRNQTTLPLSKSVKHFKKIVKDEIDYIVPDKISSSKGAGNLIEELVYHKYNNFGNPVEISRKDGILVVYIWGYNQTQLIAKIEGASLSAIPEAIITNLQNLSNNDNDRTLNYEGNEGKLRKALNALRSNTTLSQALVTSFTYDPLIGVTSMTDPRGYTMYYEYDEFNRLKFVKDAQGMLVSENKYNYKN